ncbi:MAG: M20/M25/M40 family metallo-hydrolase [Bacilli bacterium]|nr:M20/M25/M40 family metallo-hydrolase [Bacilli bacterium]
MTEYIGPILLAIVILGILVILGCLIHAAIVRNKDIRVLRIPQTLSPEDEKHASDLLELLSIKTTSYEDDEAYHTFREKMKVMFPLIHQYMKRERVNNNVVFTYQTEKQSKKILFVTHMDTSFGTEEKYMDHHEVYGPGAFDSKALLYATLRAVEEMLVDQSKLKTNITIIVTVDDETTKNGNEAIVNKFLKQGQFFNLVIEEGIGIIDPTFLELQSHFALLGIGVTGEVGIRYKVQKTQKSKEKLEAFAMEIDNAPIFKSQVDHNAQRILSHFAKDMPFHNRFLFLNIWLFRGFVKKIINADQTEFSKLLKTTFTTSSIQENENQYYVDAVFQLATHDNTSKVVRALSPFVEKYDIDYEIISIKESSKQTSEKMKGYKDVQKAVEGIYKELYVAPYIITKISDRRYLNRVSDCVIRFSPLYYPYEALQDAANGNEHIMKKSLTYGIEVYKKIIKSYEGE